MAIRIREEEVTRLDQRRKSRTREANCHRAKKESHREKMVRQHCERNGIEFSEEMLTTKAFLEVLKHKRRMRSQSRGRRQAKAIKVDLRWYSALAHEVTDYIERYWKGLIWGDELTSIYEDIAKALNELEGNDDLVADDIEIAVDFAVGRKLLRRKDPEDTSSQEWVCVNLDPAA